MEKLELKHIAPYLPYNVRLKFVSKHNIDRLSQENIVLLKQIDEGCICVNGYKTNNKSYIPILHPLSDLTKVIEHNGEKITPYNWIAENYTNCDGFFNWFKEYQHIPITESVVEYCVVEKLIEFNFDVYNLIDKNLAIDINTL